MATQHRPGRGGELDGDAATDKHCHATMRWRACRVYMHYAIHYCNLAASKRRVLAVVHDRFSVDLRCIFGERFLSGSSKVAEYARPSCVSVAFTASELCSKL